MDLPTATDIALVAAARARGDAEVRLPGGRVLPLTAEAEAAAWALLTAEMRADS